MPPILTIGHSNHTLFQFLGLLRASRVGAIADVRSSPYSKHVPHFSTGNLSQSLEQCGIAYLYMGDELGGRPDDRSFYLPDGRVDYRALAASPAFHHGLTRLIEQSATVRVAILCAEEDPNHCHRRLLIARELHRAGIAVEHIRANGTIVSEADLCAAEAATTTQLSLFAD